MLSHDLTNRAAFFRDLAKKGPVTMTRPILEELAAEMREFSAMAVALEAQKVPASSRLNGETAADFDLSNVVPLDDRRARRGAPGGGNSAA